VSQRRLQACLLQPVTLDAAAGVQAMTHGLDVMLAVGSVNTVPPAAKALLTSLAKVFAVAGGPGTVLHTALLVSIVSSCSVPAAWAANALDCSYGSIASIIMRWTGTFVPYGCRPAWRRRNIAAWPFTGRQHLS
jgi:hypothetical protein